MSEVPVYSRGELADPNFTRPHSITGHVPHTKRSSFVVGLVGTVESMPRVAHDDLVHTNVTHQPLEQNVLLSTHAYETAAEAMAVGDAFPVHAIYSDLYERWLKEREDFAADPGQAKSALAVARYALTGVYLFGPASRLRELSDYPSFQNHRLSFSTFTRVKYVFARGSDAEPLAEMCIEPQVRHGDLQPPDYQTFRRLVTAYQEILDAETIRAHIDQLEIARAMPPTASEKDLQWASIVATKIAAEESAFLPNGDAQAHCREQVYKNVMGRIFGESYRLADPNVQNE